MEALGLIGTKGLVGAVEVRASAATVEIFHRGVRVASHARSGAPHQPPRSPSTRVA